MERTLTDAQERILLREYTIGDMGKHRWKTVAALIAGGYFVDTGKQLLVSAKGKAYCDEHHFHMKL